VYMQSGGLKSTHTVWFNNSAPDGGAVAVKGSRPSSSSHVALYSNAFGHNSATAGGAGIFQGGIVLVNDTLFVANAASSLVRVFVSVTSLCALDSVIFSGSNAYQLSLTQNSLLSSMQVWGSLGTAQCQDEPELFNFCGQCGRNDSKYIGTSVARII
jgi:hypothetical protein